MPDQLPIAYYHFTCQAIDLVELPQLVDSLFYSVFGRALKQLSCIDRQQKSCLVCPLCLQCDFALLLRGISRPECKSEIAGKMSSIPSPLIFHSPVAESMVQMPAGDSFFMGLVVVGNANNKINAVIRAIQLAGELGIGRRRSRFSLVRVAQIREQGPERLIMGEGPTMPAEPPAPVQIPEAPPRIRVSFLTPWLLPDSADGLKKGFNGGAMISRIIRRISLMHEPYAGIPLQTDFKQLASLYTTAMLLDGDVQAQQHYKCSSGKKKFLAVSGWFDMDMDKRRQLWPYLFLGQWLHIPKIAAKGFGRYSLQIID
jgi:hypothetical protein